MTVPDVNEIIRKYLVEHADIIAFFLPDSPRVFCPRLPENAKLPAIGLFARGGISTPYISEMVSPSFQIDCWDDNLIGARSLYLTVYSTLQGIQNIEVGTHLILSAREEVQGIDMVDVDIPGYFRVLTFFQIMIR